MEDSGIKLAFIQGSSENFPALLFKCGHKRKGKMYLKNFTVVGLFSLRFAIAAFYFPPLQSSFEIHRLKGAENIYFYLVLVFTAESLCLG